MKLKYYLRGIGIGIIVSTAICMCASLRGTKATAAPVQEAEEESLMLTNISDASTEEGAVEEPEVIVTEAVAEEAVVTEAVNEPVTETEAEDEASDAEAEADEAKPTPEPTPEPTAEPTPEPTPEVTKEVTPEVKEETVKEKPAEESNTDYVTIVVDKGNGSDTVAKKLEAAGLIDNAKEYDKWLMSKGYDRVIAAGEHKIPKGAGDEEIAKILCRR